MIDECIVLPFPEEWGGKGFVEIEDEDKQGERVDPILKWNYCIIT